MSFIYFYFEFVYRKHRTIKRDAKLRSGDAIVSRKEAFKHYLDTLHKRALKQKNLVGGRKFRPPSEVSHFIRQKVLGQPLLTGSKVPTLLLGGPV